MTDLTPERESEWRNDAVVKGYASWTRLLVVLDARQQAEADAQAYKAMYEREKARANRAVDRLNRVRALADEYQADANSEGYGGELWSTTAAAIYRALGDGDE